MADRTIVDPPKRWLGAYTQARVWKESVHLLADLGIGIGLFTVVITMLSLSIGSLVTLVGFPLLAATVLGGRWIGMLERGRVRVLLGADLPGHDPIDWQQGLWARAKQVITDRPGWKGLAYGVLMLPWGVLTFTATVVVWTVAWSLLSNPLWVWAGDRPPTFEVNGVTYDPGEWPLGLISAGAAIIGLVLVALLPMAVHGLARADVALVRWLLTPSADEQLRQRVSDLQVSRDASVESSAGELRRIERDLHDGAQQRLVSVAMNLGLAKERLRDSDDEHAKEMVALAHEEAKQAIAELRDLVRGIHPVVLTDRGLDAAVSALVARCPMPVALHVDLPRRLPAPIEAAAYFVVSEALTNVAKHSRAEGASVRLVERDDLLTVEVHDDGIGGATGSVDGGLAGLRDRVAAVEGRLTISSPPGGPTVLSVEMPCGS